MSPTEASTDAAVSTAPGPTGRGRADGGSGTPGSADPHESVDTDDTLDLRLPDELVALIAEDDGPSANGPSHDAPTTGGPPARPSADDGLLDRLGEWGPVPTSAGVFQLVPARPERDLPLISRWMNDPAVAAFWELEGSVSLTAAHLNAQLGGDGRSIPCLGVLGGTPMSYFEVYRADLDPLARHYPARPHDTGIHLLIGAVGDRGRGLGAVLLRAVADLVLDHRPACSRVVAEPDLRNSPSISAFLNAGFRFSAELDLPDKRAALMIRDRTLRGLI